jgi:hypothetical protein
LKTQDFLRKFCKQRQSFCKSLRLLALI